MDASFFKPHHYSCRCRGTPAIQELGRTDGGPGVVAWICQRDRVISWDSIASFYQRHGSRQPKISNRPFQIQPRNLL